MNLTHQFNWDDLPSIVSRAGLENGFVVGMFSDRLYTGLWERVRENMMKEHAARQLECVRIFNDEHELKIFKTTSPEEAPFSATGDAKVTFRYRDSKCYKVVADPDDVQAETEAGSQTERSAETDGSVQSEDSPQIIVNSIEEKQLLDIDTKATKSLSQVYATGGGCYSLEGSGINLSRLKQQDKSDNSDANMFARVILEEYIRYYETGQAYVYDWRIVGFENGKEGESDK